MKCNGKKMLEKITKENSCTSDLQPLLLKHLMLTFLLKRKACGSEEGK